MHVNRRTFLLAAGACLLPPLACTDDSEPAADAEAVDTTGGFEDPVFDVTELPVDPTYTPLPVQVGAPRSTRAMLASYIISGHQQAWGVWTDGALTSQVKFLTATVSSGYVKNLAAGLAADTTYNAVLLVGEGRIAGQGGSTPIGPPTARAAVSRFRTPPVDEASPTIRFGLTSGTTSGDLAALAGLAAAEWSAFLHVGGLCDNSAGGDLAAARARWQAHLAARPFFDLFAAGAGILVPGERDLAGDAGKDALLEAVAIRPDPSTGALWTSFRWGKTVEIFVTDTVTERSKEGVPSIASAAQIDWLIAGLTESPCTFKLVLTTAPMATLPGPLSPRLGWAGIAAERDRVLDAIVGKLSGVLFVTGDLGFGSVHRLEKAGPRAALLEIAVPPAGGALSEEATSSPIPAEQLVWADAAFGSAVLALDPTAGTVVLERLAPDGSQVGEPLALTV